MKTKEHIRARVRSVVYRTLGREPGPRSPARPLITEHDLRDLPFGSEFCLPPGGLVTPLARQVAMDRRLRLVSADGVAPQPSARLSQTSSAKAVAVGADHGGFALKESLKPFIASLGYEVIDCGTQGTDAVDYPDFAHAVAQAVSAGTAWRGIMIDGAGIGSCIVANKVPGVRAGMAYDYSSAVNSREHNDTNVLTLGSGLIGLNLAKQIIKTWIF